MTGGPILLRVRTKNGLYRLQNKLNCDSTFSDLRKAIAEVANITSANLKILKGYPPKPIESSECTTLTSLDLHDGDLLTVEEAPAGEKQQQQQQQAKIQPEKAPESVRARPTQNALLRQVVPADNSCLFTSVFFCIENGKLDLSCQKSMRELIAHTVKSDPVTFNDAILGKTSSEYCKWIKDDSNWGGGIEIMILSKYYKIEICVVDIQTCRIDRFGEDYNYPSRVFIIYDGIHFDPLFMDSPEASSKKQTRFSVYDDDVWKQALEMAREVKAARQFVDVNNFKLKCLVCQKALSGQKAAQEHAEQTGHTNFGEF